MLELIANVQHKIWAHWMLYVFTYCGHTRDDGSFVIKKECVSRWKRQIVQEYKDLMEQEKESDRKQARKVLDAIGQRLAIYLLIGFGFLFLATVTLMI